MEAINPTYKKLLEIMGDYKQFLGSDKEVVTVVSYYVGRSIETGHDITLEEISEFSKWLETKLSKISTINN